MKTNLKKALVACFLNGVMFGLIKLFYESVPAPMNDLLYCTFLGFTVTFAVGGNVKEFGKYLLSSGIGLLWVGGYLVFEAALVGLPFPVHGLKAFSFGLMSFVIEFMNQTFLPETPFRFIPLQFAVVVGIFSQKCEHIPFVLIALLIGFAAAPLSKVIYHYFSENPSVE